MRTITQRRKPANNGLLCACLIGICASTYVLPASAAAALHLPQATQRNDAQTAKASTPGTPFTAGEITALLPSSVYFQGRSAPLQLRNAGGTSFGQDAIVWVSLVDTAGYSSAIQDRYQFYLVTESPLRFGDVRLPAGSYGAGFLGDRFVVMDLGGHTVGEGAVQTDSSFARPRPLQVVPDSTSAVKLYLGRKWVSLRSEPSANTR